MIEFALQNALSATMLAGVVLLASFVLRHRPAAMHALWLLVLVDLLVPPVWNLAVAPPLASMTSGVAATTVPFERAPRDRSDVMPITPASDTLPESASAIDTEPTVSATTGTSVSWRNVVLILWFAGTIGFILVTAIRIARFRRALRDCACSSASDDVVRRAAEQLGLRRVPRVVIVDATVWPMLFGVGRWTRLILPAQVLADMNERQQMAVLLHELAHYHRRDHWVRCLEIATLAVYWWHPVVWFVCRRLRISEEAACDAMVLDSQGDRTSYAMALVRCVESLRDPLAGHVAVVRPVPAATPLGAGEQLQRRIEMIVNGSNRVHVGWIGRVALVGMLFALPFAPAFGTTERANELEKRIATDFNDLALIQRGDHVLLARTPRTQFGKIHVTTMPSAGGTEMYLIPAAADDGLLRQIDGTLATTIKALSGRDEDQQAAVELARLAALRDVIAQHLAMMEVERVQFGQNMADLRQLEEDRRVLRQLGKLDRPGVPGPSLDRLSEERHQADKDALLAIDEEDDKSVGVPALMLEISDTIKPVGQFGHIEYLIRVTNLGSGPATNIGVTSSLPKNTTMRGFSGSSSVTAGANGTLKMGPSAKLHPGERLDWNLIVAPQGPGVVKLKADMFADQLDVSVSEIEATEIGDR